MVIKKVIRIGSSNGCILGKEAEILSGIKLGDTVIVTAEKNIITITKIEKEQK